MMPARRKRRWRRWHLWALVALGSVVLLRSQVIETVSVESDSMAPTICAGDRLLVYKPNAALSATNGDLVVYRSPTEDGRSVKRVVAVAGQTVEIRDAVLHVDGGRRDEVYVDPATIDGTFFGPVVVPAGAVFLLGDAREVSIDSRDYGPVAREMLDGKVLARLWSSCSD